MGGDYYLITYFKITLLNGQVLNDMDIKSQYQYLHLEYMYDSDDDDYNKINEYIEQHKLDALKEPITIYKNNKYTNDKIKCKYDDDIVEFIEEENTYNKQKNNNYEPVLFSDIYTITKMTKIDDVY